MTPARGGMGAVGSHIYRDYMDVPGIRRGGCCARPGPGAAPAASSPVVVVIGLWVGGGINEWCDGLSIKFEEPRQAAKRT